jgi:hypothetical protein
MRVRIRRKDTSRREERDILLIKAQKELIRAGN